MMSVMSCDVDAVMKKTNKPNVVVRDSCVFIFLSALMDKFLCCVCSNFQGGEGGNLIRSNDCFDDTWGGKAALVQQHQPWTFSQVCIYLGIFLLGWLSCFLWLISSA